MSQANPGDLPTPLHLDAVADALLRLNDPEQGGLRGAPKFPNPPIFRFLWQNAFRTGAPEGQDALHLMLTRMSHGGIYDHLGGGFARYATDAIWLVPHFEKMLYDNAQLLELLALAQAHRPDPLYAQRAAETVGWMARDMTAERVAGRAAFAASEDADSEGEEGRFYVWTEAEVDALLGDASAAFKRAYDVTPDGNWEGQTILRRMTPPGTVEEEAALAGSRAVLFEARAKRIRPGRDDKVLADWNGLAIAGLARAAAVFGRPDWLARAEEAFDFVLAEMSAPDGRVQHAWRLGRVTAAGLLDDQASMARAALALFETTGEMQRLTAAIRLAQAAQAAFADGHGGYYVTANDAADVPLARPRTAADNATPAATGLLAEVLARLWHLTGDAAWRQRCEALLRAFTGNPDQLAAMPIAARGGGPAGGSGDGGRRRRATASVLPDPCGGGGRRGGSGGRRGAGIPARYAAAEPSGLRQAGREHGRGRLCLPTQRVRTAGHGWRHPQARVGGARRMSDRSLARP